METPSSDSQDQSGKLGYIPIDTFLEAPSPAPIKEKQKMRPRKKDQTKTSLRDDDLAKRLTELEKKNSQLESELLSLKLTSHELVRVLDVIKKTLQEKLGEKLGEFTPYEGIQGP